SALIKSVLEAYFPSDLQIWLGPDQIASLLSEAERATLGLSHPLLDVLDASPQPNNILIIDAAERVNRELTPRVRAFVANLLARRTSDGKPAWRVVIIGQTDAWVSGQLQTLAGADLPPGYEVRELSADEVRLALRATKTLRWLAVHDEATSVLTNL